MMNNVKRLTWFITGCSTGLGRQLVKVALSRKDRVVATARSIEKLKDLQSEDCFILELDITHPMDRIKAVVDQAEKTFGPIDVVVNNAGYGILGMTEEIGSDAYHEQFKVNFYGHINVANAFLSYMRPRREGTIVFIGSRSSFRSNVPRFGPYNASKAALAAAAETMGAELKPFNVNVLTVLPGSLHTDSWVTANKITLSARSGESLEGSSYTKNFKSIPDYEPYREKSLEWALKQEQNRIQAGDPTLAAKAISDVVHGALEGRTEWPKLGMLALGEDAERDIRDKCNTVLKNLDETGEIVRSIRRPL